MITYTNVKYSDFFSFFNVSEIGRKKLENGCTVISLKPGGFKEFIDITIHLNADEILQECNLWLDRSWIGDEQALNVFAKDIAKSFIRDFVHPDMQNEVAPLVDTLFKVRGGNDIVLTRENAEVPTVHDIDSSNLRMMVETFAGLNDSWSTRFQGTLLSFENIKKDDNNLLRIAFSYGA